MFLERKFHNFFKNKERSILTKKKKSSQSQFSSRHNTWRHRRS